MAKTKVKKSLDALFADLRESDEQSSTDEVETPVEPPRPKAAVPAKKPAPGRGGMDRNVHNRSADGGNKPAAPAVKNRHGPDSRAARLPASTAGRAVERQEPVARKVYPSTDPPLPPAAAHEAADRLSGSRGVCPPPFVPNPREIKDWPKNHAPGSLKEGDSVWYRGERFWICAAPTDWAFTSYVRIVDQVWRPGGNISNTATLINVHADLLELAPVKGPAYLPQPTKHAIETKERMKATGVTDVGDDIAVMLRGKDLEQTYAIAAKYLGATVPELKAKYSGLNPGQQRMNLGNRMRGLAKKRGAIT